MEVLKVKVDFKMPSNGLRHENLKIKVKYVLKPKTVKDTDHRRAFGTLERT
jgi:hypothetical protein